MEVESAERVAVEIINGDQGYAFLVGTGVLNPRAGARTYLSSRQIGLTLAVQGKWLTCEFVCTM